MLISSGRRTGGAVVIGAGISGLVAAHELERLGHRVAVLEGSERIGGRIHTHRFGAGDDAAYAELGAMRIPQTHTLTMRYVAKLGLESALRPFSTILSDENNYLPTGRGFVRVREAAGPVVEDLRRDLPVGRYRPATVVFGAWLAATVRVLGPGELRDGLVGDLAGLLDLADGVDLAPYLRGPAEDRIDLGQVFRDHPGLRAGCGRRLEGFLDDILVETGPGLWYLSGGMAQLTDRLAASLRGPVLRRQEVTGLGVRTGGVDIRVRTRRGTRTMAYPLALCTLPFSVLRGLDLDGFDEDKRDIIRSVEYGAATKVVLHCREAFWERDGILGGASATGGRTRQTYYPPRDAGPGRGAVLLGSYAIAEDADLLGSLPKARRPEAVVEELAPLHPELKEPGMVLDSVSVAWGRNPWSQGCTSRRWGKDAAARTVERRRAARPQGRLFFAGEHCSSCPAWINGAIESALGAVKAMDAYVQGPPQRHDDAED
ncbi:NAD(P)/FAD-dependent oxidoreductase [Streptomyces sp. NPDC086554]|uniref:flavin monoamine oxidase family protein n=1 Tax=Streptomyces sp. NPDC086554 TaxID=3154864 RepID=UPI003437DDCA